MRGLHCHRNRSRRGETVLAGPRSGEAGRTWKRRRGSIDHSGRPLPSGLGQPLVSSWASVDDSSRWASTWASMSLAFCSTVSTASARLRPSAAEARPGRREPGGRRCSAALAGGGAAHHAQPEGAGERSDLHPGPSTSVSTLGYRRQQKVSGRNSTPRSHTPLNATKPFDEQWIRHSAPTQATADPGSHRRGHWFDPSIAHHRRRPLTSTFGGLRPCSAWTSVSR